MTDWESQVPVPVDGDGFLRRECPTCEREFKWLPTKNEDEATAAAGDEDRSEPDPQYFCPYCGVPASVNAWHTKAQVAVAMEMVEREVVEPQLEELERTLRDLNRTSRGLIHLEANLERESRPPAPDLSEIDDMRRIDFVCHPSEPLKVLDSWDEPVRCLVCGTAAEN